MDHDDRMRRIGLNEATFRAVNDNVEELNASLAELGDRTMHVVCECADLECMQQLVVPIDEYERIRSDATLFIVVPGHERPEAERVVEQTDGYDVVRKLPGTPARVARETDPRRSR